MIRFFIVLLSFFLVSCSYISKPTFLKYRDKTYLSARSIPPLKIPPGISSEAIETTYPVSDRSYPENAKEVSLVPPGMNES